MIIILGLVILVAAVIVSVAGVLANGGQGHQVTHFAVFGYHVTGSTGTLFLYGIVAGALGMAGLSMLLAGARRTSRRGREARGRLVQSRRQTDAVSADRDSLIGQRDTARAYTASTLGDDRTARNGSDPAPRRSGLSRRLLGRRPARPLPAPPASQAPAPVTAAQPEPQAAAVPAAPTPASASAPAE